ncbi:unnamed protein product, partial [Ixodes hexagonus]
MSNIVEKTVNSLQNYVGKNILGGNFYLQEVLSEIASAPSKEDEDELIAKRLSTLEKDMKEYTKAGRMEGCLLQAMYFEMLGHPTPFAYMHAVKLLQQGNLRQKLIGYLATSVFLHPNHELTLLLINSIQRDLSSNVSLIIVMALAAIPKLIHGELASSVQSLVLEKTSHHSSAVRTAALIALQHCHSQCGSNQIPRVHLAVLEKGLADPDVTVVASAAHCLSLCTKVEPSTTSHLCPSLLELLAQLRQKTVHSDYEFGGISVPWLQATILSTLGQMSLDTEQVAQLLKEVLDSRVINQTIYYAVIWECLGTVASIMNDNTELTRSSIACIAKMLHSSSTDLNYSGVDALERVLSKCCPTEAVTCQEVIIDCLHHPDESVRIKTLNLLVTMANESNVAVIVNRIMKYISTTTDPAVQSFVCDKVIHLLRIYPFSHNFAFDVKWVATTFCFLLFLVPHLVSDTTVFHFINLFSSGESVVQHIIPHVLQAELNLSRGCTSAVHLMAWAFGEVTSASPGCSLSDAQQRLMLLLEQHNQHKQLSLNILCSLFKLTVLSKQPLNDDQQLVAQLYDKAPNLLVKQRLRELLNLNKVLSAGRGAVPEMSDFREDTIKVDTTLSFLDAYVCKALENGAAPYRSRALPLFLHSPDIPTASSQTVPSEVGTFSSQYSAADTDVLSPEYHSFASEVMSDESPAKRQLWSTLGRKKDVQDVPVELLSTALERTENPKVEDAELMRSLFTSTDPVMVS